MVNSAILLLSDSQALLLYSPLIYKEESKVILYQKDKDLEEVLLLYYVQGKTFKIVHDQMSKSMNTEACKMVLFLHSWLLAYYTIPAEYCEYLVSTKYSCIILWK